MSDVPRILAACDDNADFATCCFNNALVDSTLHHCQECQGASNPKKCLKDKTRNWPTPDTPCRYGPLMDPNTKIPQVAQGGTWEWDAVSHACQKEYPGVVSCGRQICAQTQCTGVPTNTDIPTLLACPTPTPWPTPTPTPYPPYPNPNNLGKGYTQCPDGTYVKAGTSCAAGAPGTVGNRYTPCPDGSFVRSGTKCPDTPSPYPPYPYPYPRPHPSPYPIPNNDPYYPGIQICPNPTGSRFPIVVPANMTCPYFDEAAIAIDRAYSWGSPYRRWY
jgi:hypothetical protein